MNTPLLAELLALWIVCACFAAMVLLPDVWYVPCPRCANGNVRVELIACSQIPQVSCDHYAHFHLIRCWLCRGTARVDRLTAWIAKRRAA